MLLIGLNYLIRLLCCRRDVIRCWPSAELAMLITQYLNRGVLLLHEYKPTSISQIFKAMSCIIRSHQVQLLHKLIDPKRIKYLLQVIANPFQGNTTYPTPALVPIRNAERNHAQEGLRNYFIICRTNTP